jgi:D-alanyl-D-alanine carboxypeptidase/D-alanyl-D-alanine-endopeptidase (penicillin-binding protein 4)
MIRYVFPFLLFAISCSPVSKQVLNRKFKSLEEKFQDHTGFMLYDLEEKREIYSFQSNHYFTPASNTKIFTLYTGLMVLGDSIPALRYSERGDSLIFSGTGDPSFLYPYVHDSRKAFDFLARQQRQLYFAEKNFFTSPLGPGWSWDDYSYAYSSERSAFPVYGNIMKVSHHEQSLKIVPTVFTYRVSVGDTIERSKVVRDIGSNKITFYPAGDGSSIDTFKIPFKTSAQLTSELLSDTLKRKVTMLERPFHGESKLLYSVPSDSLYKVMMQESDNFIAEQLLLVCAGVLSDSLKPEIAIEYMKKNHLNNLPDKPIWVDGSGLSRYNLFTPRSIVRLWEKIYQQVPKERLFPLLAIGGKTGTIKNAYKNGTPYIYGKTGTLSNNHCLSGYLITKKGKTLIFSFMNNNHPAPSSTIRKEMEHVLRSVYENY